MRRTCIVLIGMALGVSASSASGAELDAKGIEFFEKKIRPVLVEHCYSCHSAEAKKKKGGLALDTSADLLKGGETGPGLTPGKPETSLLLEVMNHKGDVKMPPKGPLPESVQADFRAWIAMGAPDPRQAGAVKAVAFDWHEAQKHWSFQPIRKAAPPAVKNVAWARTDLDRFVLSRLESEGLRPAPTADKATLLRRVHFDLIGLPPTPEELDAFLKDESPDAYAKVVERLLASPHYGERWARHWLDVARYAEDQAHTFAVQPNTQAFRYRDWVIDAFNADMPYDRFVKLQIAADLMENANPPASIADRSALGFFGLGAQYYKNTDAARAIAEELDDRIDTLARGFLGLTVSCARCHDHKFDPIPTLDYYSLAGVFNSSKLANLPLAPKAEVDRFQEAQRKMQESEKKLKDLLAAERKRLAEAEAEKITAYLSAAWQIKARRQSEPKYSVKEQAKVDGLNHAVLDRWLKFLDASNKVSMGLSALEAWRKLPLPSKEAKPEAGPEVRQAGEEFQQFVQEALGKGLPDPKAKSKAGKEKERQDVLKALFAENGVFVLTDAEAMARLEGERKAKMESLRAESERFKKEMPPAPPMTHGITDDKVADLHVYVRGNPATPGEVAPRRFLRILSTEEPKRFTKGSGRLELAECIASKDNPLTARVFVNRVWSWHFGRGLVGTPSNFGKLGDRPTHPELLDYLASRFMESNWSIKALQREIVLSAVYQQASEVTEEGQRKDPDNRLLSRSARHRLDVESWRDALLAASGELDRTFGGPTLDLASKDNRRRTVYCKVSRHELNGLLRLFDFPDANITSERRTETTVPQQQLFVLNSTFFVAQAKSLAKRLQKEAPDDKARIERAYKLCYGRSASNDEVDLALRYLTAKDDPAETSRNQLTRWERYAQVLLAGNEFLYID